MASATLLDAVEATGAGASVEPPIGTESFSVQITGISGDTVQIQASNDDTNWSQVGDDITANGIYSVESGALYYRANVTAYSAGTITAVAAGYAT